MFGPVRRRVCEIGGIRKILEAFVVVIFVIKVLKLRRKIDVGYEDALRISLALILFAFIDVPFLLTIIPASLSLANHPYVTLRYGFPKQIISSDFDFSVLTRQVKLSIRLHVD